MIKAVSVRKDGPLFIFGLSEENIRLLKSGKPIKIDLGDLQQQGHIFIYYGETDEDIKATIEPFVGEMTKRYGL